MVPPRQLAEQLKRDEGLVLHAYNDSLGYCTIGYGRLIDNRKGGGITQQEATYLLENDIRKVSAQINQEIPWAVKLDYPRFSVLCNMAFQMGIAGLLKFENTLKMIQSGDYEGAGKGMLNSLWATQTPERAARLAKQMLTGQFQ